MIKLHWDYSGRLTLRHFVFKHSRKLALGAALLASTSAIAFETTTFSVNLNDSTRTGTMLLGNFNLGDFAPNPSAGANSFNTAFQFLPPPRREPMFLGS